jgi:hypothetical protein
LLILHGLSNSDFGLFWLTNLVNKVRLAARPFVRYRRVFVPTFFPNTGTHLKNLRDESNRNVKDTCFYRVSPVHK